MIGLIILILVIALIVWVIAAYNGLVALRTHVDESWSQIDVQLQRRNDLIPNLVNTVKGYSKFESSTLEKVTALRSDLQNIPDDADVNKIMKKSDQLSNCLRSIFAVSENYPDLKASSEYSKLMEELQNTENKIAYSRQLYNSTVANYDKSILQFPKNIIAKIFKFTKRDYLKTDDKAKEVPKVEF